MKKILISALGVALLMLLTIVAFAHSGRTDSNGGHHNNSTGEYHYHHGYSAHNHYDMDGDGDLDCPYEFDDKTNHGNSSTNTSEKVPDSSSESKDTPKKEKKITFLDVVGIVFSLILLSLATLHSLYIVLGLISIFIESFAEKWFKMHIEKSKMKRILHISIIIGFVILLPLEILCILGIL